MGWFILKPIFLFIIYLFLYFHRSFGDIFECKIELQLKNNRPDVNALNNASYCYIIDDEFCLLQDLVVRRGKSLSKYKYIYLEFLDVYAIRHIKIKTIAIRVEQRLFN